MGDEPSRFRAGFEPIPPPPPDRPGSVTDSSTAVSHPSPATRHDPAMSEIRHRAGELGESAVCELLAGAGRPIVERNARTRFGELDVIYIDRETLVFAEIKALRGRAGSDAIRALQSIGPQKQRQVRRLARAWLGERPSAGSYEQIRFDAFGVCIGPHDRIIAIEHIEAAF
jgi:putative endonuclease